MPVLWSCMEGPADPRTLPVTDFIELEVLGQLDPEIAKLGFYTYAKSKEDLLEIAQLDTDEYKAIVKALLESPNLLYYNTVRLLAPNIAALRLRERILAMANRRPSVLVNGLPSVQEDGMTINASIDPPVHAQVAAPPTTDPTSTISPQRGIAKMNMLRRMRPPPFQHAWTFYHDKHSDDGNYEGRLTVLLENIITIKPFWEAYNSFPLQALKFKDSVHFFKRGVKPVWEDPRNVKGGTWTFRVSKEKYEETWKEILLLAVGEEFSDVIQPKDDLCGISLSVRFNANLIMIWNRDGGAQASIDGIRDVVLAKLSAHLVPKDGTYYYKQHSAHTGFRDVVAKAAEQALVSGKIEEAKVREGEVEEELLREVEEQEREEGRRRAVTMG